MPRLSRFRHVRHPAPHRSPYSDRYTPSSFWSRGHRRLFSEAATDRWNHQAGRYAGKPKALLMWANPNGHNDPLTVMLVVDELLRLETDGYVQAGGLTKLLQEDIPHVLWDPFTVGRVLAGLHELGADAAPDKDFLPMGKTSHGGAVMYALSEDVEPRMWLGTVRARLGQLVERLVKTQRERNLPIERTTEVWDTTVGGVAWTDRPDY